MGIEKNSENVVLLAGNRSLANSTATTLYADCKDELSVKTTVF